MKYQFKVIEYDRMLMVDVDYDLEKALNDRGQLGFHVVASIQGVIVMERPIPDVQTISEELAYNFQGDHRIERLGGHD